MIRPLQFFTLLSMLVFGETAAALVIARTDASVYREDGFHIPNSTEFFTGISLTDLGSEYGYLEYRNYFVFDLSGSGPVGSATLRAYLIEDTEEGGPGYWGPEATQTWELFDVTTNIADLMGGPDSVSAFADLGSGIQYGEKIVSRADLGKYVEVSLNAAALASINSASGLWAVGGHLLDLNRTFAEYIFGYSYLDPRVELVVTPGTVPAPTTAQLLVLALAALYWLRRSYFHLG